PLEKSAEMPQLIAAELFIQRECAVGAFRIDGADADGANRVHGIGAGGALQRKAERIDNREASVFASGCTHAWRGSKTLQNRPLLRIAEPQKIAHGRRRRREGLELLA